MQFCLSNEGVSSKAVERYLKEEGQGSESSKKGYKDFFKTVEVNAYKTLFEARTRKYN